MPHGNAGVWLVCWIVPNPIAATLGRFVVFCIANEPNSLPSNRLPANIAPNSGACRLAEILIGSLVWSVTIRRAEVARPSIA